MSEITEKHLFLDLEGTVVAPLMNGWFNFNLMNVDLIKKWIEAIQPDHIHIFSFAIHNEFDVKSFNMHLRSVLERVFFESKMSFEMVPTTDLDILPICARAKRLSPEMVSFNDMCDFWGKEFTFQLFVRQCFPDDGIPRKVFLLDDTVEFSSFHFIERKIQGEFIRIPI